MIASKHEGENLLSELNPFSLSGPDETRLLILEEAHVTLAETFTILLQTCLGSRIFPTSWNKAAVNPVFKKIIDTIHLATDSLV